MGIHNHKKLTLLSKESRNNKVLVERLQIRPSDLEREIAALRHMEKVRGELRDGKESVMSGESSIFEKTYRDYLARVAELDLGSMQETLGIKVDGDEAIVPFFGQPYRVSANGIFSSTGKESEFSVSVVLCKYLLMCPEFTPKGHNWVSYKDFKDAAPFAGAFVNAAERPIAENFANGLEELKEACKSLGGRVPDMDLSYDLSVCFDPLPRVPMLMLFNDADDEFPAQCWLLFERRAERYLDMECVAILGMLLSEYLKKAGG